MELSGGGGERARNQIGLLFLAMSAALSAGAVGAARSTGGEYLQHTEWWWWGYALLTAVPGLVFAVVPWLIRVAFSIPTAGAVEDAERAFFSVAAGAAAMAAVDAAAIGLLRVFDARGVTAAAAGYGLAPLLLALASAAIAGKRAALVLLPAAAFNALLVEWAGGFAGRPFVR
ncbi:MAG: hypothetical protein IT452_01640 [Planctomycetia bacterium]|nr:hypothetical protein [Planctomycetia bacterium]